MATAGNDPHAGRFGATTTGIVFRVALALALASALLATGVGISVAVPLGAQDQPPPPISPNDTGETPAPGASVTGGYHVYLYVVANLEPGTTITFKRLTDNCTKEEFDGSFEVTSKPYLKNLRAFYVPRYNITETCAYVASNVRWRVTATRGSTHQRVEIIVSQKPQIPLQQDYSTQCVPGGSLPCSGGSQPSTPLPKVIFGKIL